MQQFFVTADQVQENQIYIEGTDVNHMKNVLRMRPGEKLGISDGNNHHYICQVEKYLYGKKVSFTIKNTHIALQEHVNKNRSENYRFGSGKNKILQITR